MASRLHDSESAPDADSVAAGRKLAGPVIGILICSLQRRILTLLGLSAKDYGV